MSKESNVTFAADGARLEGYLRQPEGPGPFPAVVVIHELFGLNDNIRRITDRFAAEGFVALAPNLFSRPGGIPRFCVTQMVKAFITASVDQVAVRDLTAAVTYLKGLDAVRADRTGVVGFCLGGGFALLVACASDEIKAGVSFYGRNPGRIDAVADIQCPILYFYGKNDRLVRGGVPKLEQAMRDHGKSLTVRSYPNASHSFMNDGRGSYRPEAADDAWRHMLGFFREHLTGSSHADER